MNSPNQSALKASLASLYSDKSKHSSYQSVPDFVAKVIDYQEAIQENWRGDSVRLSYIESRLASKELVNWCDFGANTGFFSLTLAHRYPERQLLAVEANPNHAAFISKIIQAFHMGNIQVLGEPITLETLAKVQGQDVMLHLNVLHHAGADFDKGLVSGTDDFLTYAEEYLRRLRKCTRKLVFQLGSNLWGDKSKPIIDHRADAEKLALFAGLLQRAGWRIDEVAYAANNEGRSIEYRALSFDVTSALESDLPRISMPKIESALEHFNLSNHIGEFYRRPLFICTGQ